MARELATVKSHVLADGDGRRADPSGPAEELRLRFADAWGEVRAGDPIVEVIGRTADEAAALPADHPTDGELAALRDWLLAFNAFVRLFDRAVGLVPKLEPRELERGMRLLGQVSDEAVL